MSICSTLWHSFDTGWEISITVVKSFFGLSEPQKYIWRETGAMGLIKICSLFRACNTWIYKQISLYSLLAISSLYMLLWWFGCCVFHNCIQWHNSSVNEMPFSITFLGKRKSFLAKFLTVLGEEWEQKE